MDKGAIERFAISARNKLRHSVDLKMTEIGTNPEYPAKVDVVGSYVIITNTSNGIEKRLSSEENRARTQLISAVSQNGYDNVVESVAYTWFNRLIAIRYMEVNGYLPTRVRVLSSITPGKKEPDIVSQCSSVRLSTTNLEREKIEQMQTDGNSDGLFKLMFLIQCRELNKILPELFTVTKAYENMLCDLSYTNPDSVVRDLVDTIPEEDFKNAVQIIGWMYQFYNTELKDDTFFKLKKNIKISKERIPSATQLFTPDWIVRYMVENSIGRIWLEGHPNDALKSKWTYYIEEAEQTSAVNTILNNTRKERPTLTPEDITVIDPCMGSGHILVYAFDVLMQIYESYGYSKEDAARLIIEKNLHGLDIDDRAYQMAYFSVLMKARQYNETILNYSDKNNLCSIIDSTEVAPEVFSIFGKKLSEDQRKLAYDEITSLIRTFADGKTAGSLIECGDFHWDNIYNYLIHNQSSLSYPPETEKMLLNIVKVGKMLSDDYSVVITNPPYLGFKGMNSVLLDYLKRKYPDSYYDLFSCFVERVIKMTKDTGYASMIVQQSLFFLSSFTNLRRKIIDSTQISSFVQLGPHAFDTIGGEVVQTATFVISKTMVNDYVGHYKRLINGQTEREKEQLFHQSENDYCLSQNIFNKIPDSPIAYWVDPNIIELFETYSPLSDVTHCEYGFVTGDNNSYLRYWFEVDNEKIDRQSKSDDDFRQSKFIYAKCCKGGSFRRWYGNNEYVVKWKMNDNFCGNCKSSINQIFTSGLTWTAVSSKFGVRYLSSGYVTDHASPSMYFINEKQQFLSLGLLNTSVSNEIINFINPTINFGIESVGKIPLINNYDTEQVVIKVKKCIELCEKDWNKREISPDFVFDITITNNTLVSDYCEREIQQYDEMKRELSDYEKEIDKTITDKMKCKKDNEVRYGESIIVPSTIAIVKKLLSYAVGCMFGRYSLDTPGLCYAGGVWDSSKYSSFIPDPDNIIPINDEEYFGDDVVTYFESFIETVFGKETLEENLKYIANALEIKGSGTAREKIRKYFLNDFYKDHIQMYQKCPIYWLFDSGKANGFKALVYMHRYTPDLIGKMRQNYLLKMQRIYDEQYGKERDQVRRTAIRNKLDEIERYDLAVELYASKNVSIDLDDGVKHNYALFQGIENSKSSKDKIDLLYRI